LSPIFALCKNPLFVFWHRGNRIFVIFSMPELPEVETTIREMKKEKIPGLKIKDIWTDFPKMIHLMPAKKISKQDA